MRKRFNIGQKVKIQEDRRHERTGTVLEIVGDKVMVGVGEPHYFNYEKRLISPVRLYNFNQISDDDARIVWQSEFPKAFDYAKEMFARFLPNNFLEFNESDLMIQDKTTGICLSGEIVERRSIGSVTEIAGYSVSGEIFVPGCRTMPNGDPGYPDDVDIVELGTYNNYRHAVIGMMKEVFASNIESELQRESEEALARSYMMDEDY